jgi:tetratricopeptide (TPR) repeat protein
MSKKGRLRLAFSLAIVFGGLFLIRSAWQPWLLAAVTSNQESLEAAKLLLEVMQGVAFLLTSLYGAYLFFLSDSNGRVSESLKALAETSPQKILLDYVGEQPDAITWQDRKILAPNDLPDLKRILLVGRMKSGKSREAAELIRRAIDDMVWINSRVYDINPGLRGLTPETLQPALQRELDKGGRVLFFANDLPKQAAGKQLESLGHYLDVLDQCSPGYFLATARSDHLYANPALVKWLERNQVKVIDMKDLSPEQRACLVDELGQKTGMEIDDEAKKILAEETDGTPYHIILTIKRLSEDKNQPISVEQASRVVRLSQAEIWIEFREALKKAEPATVSLLEALAVFYHANVTPEYSMVMAYAADLERARRRWAAPWIVRRRLNRAVALLQPYGVYHRSPFVFPDVAVETLIQPEEGLPRLERFLRKYRRLYRNRLLRRINPLAGLQQSIFVSLSASYYFAQNLPKAEELLKLALSAGDPSAVIWYNLGVLLDDLERAEEAEQAYRRAVEANPEHASAWYNLGNLLDDLERAQEAEQAYRRAVEANP